MIMLAYLALHISVQDLLFMLVDTWFCYYYMFHHNVMFGFLLLKNIVLEVKIPLMDVTSRLNILLNYSFIALLSFCLRFIISNYCVGSIILFLLLFT